MSQTTERTLNLKLVCGCAAALARRKADDRFALNRFDKATACDTHRSPPDTDTVVTGFGPYPDWGANAMLRVGSVPEAGGMMEREHAFILDGQFAFFEAADGPRPIGPILDAAWSEPTLVNH